MATLKTGKLSQEAYAKIFTTQLQLIGVHSPEQELIFDAPANRKARKWQFDFAWPEAKVAVEIEGGGWINGGHNRGVRFHKDMEKYNAAAEQGWVVLRYSREMAFMKANQEQIKSLIQQRTP
jgi:hypothetical protein